MTDTAQRLWGVVEPYVAAEGVELDDIEVLGSGDGGIVRITLDGDGLGVDRIADISEGLSRLIDDADPLPGSYTLEVSSPGLERHLRRPRHYEKSIGREVKVRTVAEIEGTTSLRGTLRSVDGEGFVVDVDGRECRVRFAEVASARTIFLWERRTKPGGAREREG